MYEFVKKETGMMKNSSNIRVIHKLVRLCQRLIPICCCVLTFFSVAGVSSVKRCAYVGQAVKLLSNIGNDYADPSLYNENGTMIASWKENTNTVAYMDPNYSGRIYMEERRNIWILSVERNDAGRYSFKFGVQIERLDIELIVKEELTEEQLQECPNNGPDFPKEGRVMSEQILLQLLCNHPQKVMTEPYGSNSLIIGMLSTLLVITSLNIVVTNKTYIRNGWITGKHWIQETLCSKHTRPKPSLEATSITIEESELTECQVQNWLEGHPDFMEKYNESLTEFQVQDWLDLHPDFMKKYYDEDEQCLQAIPPTLDELGITVKGKGTGCEGNSGSTGEQENHLQATPPTLDELGITVKGTGREGNQKQWMPSQESVITFETCSSSSSDSIDSFRETGYSGMQSIHKDEKKADPEENKVKTDSVENSGVSMKVDAHSDDDYSAPLLSKNSIPK